MPKGFEISSNDETFIREALKNGLRLDGRKLDEFRDIDIAFGSRYGHVEVSLGKTKIAVKISAEIMAPFEDRPFEGLFQISTEISPMASAIFESGRQSTDEILITRLIEKAIRRSSALDLESLCVVAGSKCWSIRADIHFLDFDGNFIDVSCLGVIVALLHFKKPDVSVVGESVIVHSVQEREPVPLSILHIPICVTFSFYNPNDIQENVKGDLNNEIIVLDTTMKEEFLRNSSLTLTLNKNKEIVQISKAGGLSIDAVMIMQCCNKAFQIVSELTDRIKKELQKDHEKRVDPRETRELRATNERE